jgi:hypothetical protein
MPGLVVPACIASGPWARKAGARQRDDEQQRAKQPPFHEPQPRPVGDSSHLGNQRGDQPDEHRSDKRLRHDPPCGFSRRSIPRHRPLLARAPRRPGRCCCRPSAARPSSSATTSTTGRGVASGRPGPTVQPSMPQCPGSQPQCLRGHARPHGLVVDPCTVAASQAGRRRGPVPVVRCAAPTASSRPPGPAGPAVSPGQGRSVHLDRGPVSTQTGVRGLLAGRCALVTIAGPLDRAQFHSAGTRLDSHERMGGGDGDLAAYPPAGLAV